MQSCFTLTVLRLCTQGAALPLVRPVWCWTSLWETARWGQPLPLHELQRKPGNQRTHIAQLFANKHPLYTMQYKTNKLINEKLESKVIMLCQFEIVKKLFRVCPEIRLKQFIQQHQLVSKSALTH